METDKKPFETWAVVEVMGHRQIAGRVTEEPLAGVNMLRVDVPSTPAWPEPFTKYFGGGSIYAIHPCTEAVARAAAERLTEQWGFTPMPVGVPDLSDARETIRQARALADQRALPAGSSGGYDEDAMFSDLPL